MDGFKKTMATEERRKVRVGMVGGGPGAGIAETHRTAMRLDDRYDNAKLLLRFSNGARGTLWASMAAVGNEHGLRIRVYGDRGSLAWHHEDPHHLCYYPIDGSPQILAQGADWLSPDARRWTRVGLGHPEGFFEAFANLYTEVADALLAKSDGKPYAKADLGFPDVTDGARGASFVESAMRSYTTGGVWTPVESI
jgi:predicted dehydrogenase